jgi:anti-sigma B factor antagonist
MHEVRLTGDIDRSAEAQLDEGYAAARAAGATDVLLDFSAATYINSSGIALIVGVLARARADGVTVSARGLSDHYREIFEVTRLSDFVTILDDQGAEHA